LTVVLRRLRAGFPLVLVVILLTAALVPLPVAAADPPGTDRFLKALGQVESGGRYDARNPTSGARGKYQIMPANWPSWAKKYLGSSTAAWTWRNQEKVARGKVKDLHRWLKAWPSVAHWWLTGNGDTNRNRWSGYSKRYVDKVMTLYKKYGGTPTTTTSKSARAQETSLTYSGSWRRAQHSGYSGGAVNYATAAGATARFRFTGKSITWTGPVGPTRGKANVYVDGKLVKTVDLYSATYRARVAVFTATWGSTSKHTIAIKVVGTKGRPTVAIDSLVLTR
jgi:hypothetical protein